ncbi:MAG: CADD family putative folate metabolism protein [Dehalococcoidia bacterium]|nr:CADD family putative folate metabolism protein [Dehalococcoidia bacterium]
MTTTRTPIADEVDALIEERSLLKHPFYQAWQRGELTLDALRDYAGQYYHHVLAFPQYVSAAHATCPDQRDRQELLENLIEEDRGDENHPELWLRFGEALGLSREAVEESEPRPQTQRLVQTYRDVTRNGPFAQAATALYCYESQVPEIARQKIAGLQRFYGIDDERGLEFFTVHIDADEWHAEVGRGFVDSYGQDDPDAVRETARQCLDALWTFLDGVYDRMPAAGAAG